MTQVITLDFDDVAAEWQDLLDEQEALSEDGPMDELASGQYEELEQETQPYIDLCDELGLSHEPDSLRWYGRDHTLIRGDTFVDYMREYGEETCEVPDAISSYVDWEKFADANRSDYYSHTYDGHEWLVRA